MPLLRFYTTPGQLSAGDKAELAEFFTNIYSAIMPDFYVNIVFNEVSEAPPHFRIGTNKLR